MRNWRYQEWDVGLECLNLNQSPVWTNPRVGSHRWEIGVEIRERKDCGIRG